MPHLVQLLSNNTDLRDPAALALGNIPSDLLAQPQLATSWKAAFLAAGAVPATARLLNQPSMPHVQAAATGIVCLLAW